MTSKSYKKYKKHKKREDKYQIKCIEYFLDYDLVVYGNTGTYFRYLPMCFLSLSHEGFKFKIDIDSWEELYNSKSIIMKILEQELREWKKSRKQ